MTTFCNCVLLFVKKNKQQKLLHKCWRLHTRQTLFQKGDILSNQPFSTPTPCMVVFLISCSQNRRGGVHPKQAVIPLQSDKDTIQTTVPACTDSDLRAIYSRMKLTCMFLEREQTHACMGRTHKLFTKRPPTLIMYPSDVINM